MIVPPGFSRPARSASSIIRTAIRSLMELPGLNVSIFARTVAPITPRVMRLMRTIGVWPMVSRMVSRFSSRRKCSASRGPALSRYGRPRHARDGTCAPGRLLCINLWDGVQRTFATGTRRPSGAGGSTLATGLLASSSRGRGAQADAQEGDRVRAHVEFLADDLLEGREAGTRGFDVASRYAASVLEVNGLEPAGDQGTFFQAVPLVESTLTQGSVTLVRDGSPPTALENPADVAIMPNHVEDQVHLQAPVVFAGFGVTAPAFNYDDYAGLDVTGKVVLVLSNGPARFPSEQRAHFGSFELKVRNAAEHGAVGMIIGGLPEEYARTPWDRRASRYADPHITWVDAQGNPGTGDARLHAVAAVGPTGLEKLFAESPVPSRRCRRTRRPAGRRALRCPSARRIDTTTSHRRLASRNIVGRLRGRDAALADDLRGADRASRSHRHRQTVNGDSLNNGAYDNATGSAILLEVARQLASGQRPRRSILIVFVTAEEKGLIGSDYFARHPVVTDRAHRRGRQPRHARADVAAGRRHRVGRRELIARRHRCRVTGDNGLKVQSRPHAGGEHLRPRAISIPSSSKGCPRST